MFLTELRPMGATWTVQTGRPQTTTGERSDDEYIVRCIHRCCFRALGQNSR